MAVVNMDDNLLYNLNLLNKLIGREFICNNKELFSDEENQISTIQREVGPLLQIKDAYPKIVIARTKLDSYQYEGVQIYDIANWLAE